MSYCHRSSASPNHHEQHHRHEISSGSHVDNFAGRGAGAAALGFIDMNRHASSSCSAFTAGKEFTGWEESVTMSILDAASRRSPTPSPTGSRSHSRSPSAFLKQFHLTSPSSSRATLFPRSPSSSPEISTTPFLSPSSLNSPLTPSLSSSSSIGPETPPTFLHSHPNLLPPATPPRSSSLINNLNTSNLSPIISPPPRKSSSNRLGSLWRKGSATNLQQHSSSRDDGLGPESFALSDPSFSSIAAASKSKLKVKKGNALGLTAEGITSSTAKPVGKTFAYKGIEGGPQVAAKSRRGSVSGSDSLSSRISKSFSSLEQAASSIRGRSSQDRTPLPTLFGLNLDTSNDNYTSQPHASSASPLLPPIPFSNATYTFQEALSAPSEGADEDEESIPPTPTASTFSRPPAPPPFIGFGIRSSSFGSSPPQDRHDVATSSNHSLLLGPPAQIDQTALFEKVRASFTKKPTPPITSLEYPSTFGDFSLSTKEHSHRRRESTSERDRQDSNASFATSGESSAWDAIAEDVEIGFGELRNVESSGWGEGTKGPLPVSTRTDYVSPFNRASVPLPDDEELQSWLPHKRSPLPPPSTNPPSVPHYRQSSSSSSKSSYSSTSDHVTPTQTSEAAFRSTALPATVSYLPRPAPPASRKTSRHLSTSAAVSVLPQIEVQVTEPTPEKGHSTTRVVRSDSVGSVSSVSSDCSSGGSSGCEGGGGDKARFTVVADEQTGSWVAVSMEDDSDRDETSISIPLSRRTLQSSLAPSSSSSSASTLLCVTHHLRSDSGQTISPLSHASTSSSYPHNLSLNPHLRLRSTSSSNTQSSLVDSYYFSPSSSFSATFPPSSNGSHSTRLSSEESTTTRPSSIRSTKTTASSSSSCYSSSSSGSDDSIESLAASRSPEEIMQMEKDLQLGWNLGNGGKVDMERLERELFGIEEETMIEEDVIRVDATLFPMPPLRRIWVAVGGAIVETEMLGKKVEYFPSTGIPLTPRQLIFQSIPHSIEDRTPFSYRQQDQPLHDEPDEANYLTGINRKRRDSLTAIHHFSTEEEEEEEADACSEMGSLSSHGSKKSTKTSTSRRRMSLSGWMKKGSGADKAARLGRAF